MPAEPTPPADPLQIVEGGLDDPAVRRLLVEHARELRSVSPPGSAHVLDLSGLEVPGVRAFTAYVGRPRRASPPSPRSPRPTPS